MEYVRTIYNDQTFGFCTRCCHYYETAEKYSNHECKPPKCVTCKEADRMHGSFLCSGCWDKKFRSEKLCMACNVKAATKDNSHGLCTECYLEWAEAREAEMPERIRKQTLDPNQNI